MADLVERWLALHPAADVPTAAAAGEHLLQRYAEPHRRYHDARHLTEVLDAVDELAHHARDLRAVRLAAWLHDAVYDTNAPAGANEAASADLAASVLAPLGHRDHEVRAVARLVLLTATHVPTPEDCDGHVLCDADLRILASSSERYSQYAADVRAEYSAVPDAAFASGRTSILNRLLENDHLFATATGRERWEHRARANIADEVARLTAGRR